MLDKPCQQLEDHERNAFIEAHLTEIKTIAQTLTDDPSVIEDLTNEGVVILLEYFSDKSYKTKPVNLRQSLRQRILLHLRTIVKKQNKEKINQGLFIDTLPQPEQNNPFEKIYLEQRRQAVNESLNRVLKNKRLNQIIRDRYGCNTVKSPNGSSRITFDNESHTVKEIHMWLGISRARIHQLLTKGLVALRVKRRTTNLPDYIDWNTPQIIDTDDFGIGYANIDGQDIKVIDLNNPYSLIDNSYYWLKYSLQIQKDFIEFLETEGVERFKNMAPIDFSSRKSSYFIRHSDFEEYVKKFKELSKK